MKQRIDLHLHTTRSDGARTPAELLDYVRDRRLVGFSVTDHDTIDGFRDIKAMLVEGDPELIPGVELSCSGPNGDLHMLAYCFDPDHPELASALEDFRERRNQRGQKMVQRLNDLGLQVNYETVVGCAAGAPVGRPHVAEALVELGIVSDFDTAFHKYLGDHAPAFVPKENMSPEEAIDLIHACQGLAVVAHPMIHKAVDSVEALSEKGLDGIEAWHPDHRQSDVDRLKHMAERFDLLITGGSDYHGRGGRNGSVGSEPVGVEIIQKLSAAAQRRRG